MRAGSPHLQKSLHGFCKRIAQCVTGPGKRGRSACWRTIRPGLGQQRFGKLSTRKMPSWFADPRYGKFSNATALTQDEIDTLAGWVEAGAPEGDPDDMPAPMQFFEGWQNRQAGSRFRVAQTLRSFGVGDDRLSARDRAERRAYAAFPTTLVQTEVRLRDGRRCSSPVIGIVGDKWAQC